MIRRSFRFGIPAKLFCVCSCVATFTSPALGHAHARNYQGLVPSHLSIKDQYLDLSVTGLRAYLDTIKLSDSPLHAQLTHDVERLESRAALARTLLLVGVTVGLASTLYAFAGKTDCSPPSITDPNFAAKTTAWGDCNADSRRHLSTFGLIGFGAFAAGGIGALIAAPKRPDLLEVVNKHNRLNAEPLQLHLGYDPLRRSAHAAATFRY